MGTPVTIIGAGPAGMTAALFAARAGKEVTLIESNSTVGRKLLVTGAGRANLTNKLVSAERYTCSDPAWMRSVLAQFGHSDLISFLESIGVLTYSTSDGWCYPLSESAQTVVDAFYYALHQAGVKTLLDHKTTTIQKTKGGFALSFKTQRSLECERLIVAAGGAAYPTLGSRGALYPSLKELGHTINPVIPALAPVLCQMQSYEKLQGMRLDARIRLYENQNLLAETSGNLIFTAWGLNGPAVMDLSHHISSRPGEKLSLALNPLFNSEPALRQLIQRQRGTSTPLKVILGAVLPPKAAPVLLPLAGIPATAKLNQVTENDLEKMFALLTAIPFKVTGVRGFEFCQVSAGGVPVREVDPRTMHSHLVAGLSLAGEVMDVVGPCGGYNLQFAFSSGALAGMHI